MRTTLSTRAAAECQAALQLLGNNLDPEKCEAFDVTLTVADALSALATALVPFETARTMLQKQHGFRNLKEGDPLPSAYIEAIAEVAERPVKVDLPDPIARADLKAALKIGVHPADLVRLGPMLERRPLEASAAHAKAQ